MNSTLKNKNGFIINYNKIVNRFDAQYYWEDINFDSCIKLSTVAKVSGGKRLPKGFDYSKEETIYRYLRIGDVNWDGSLNYHSFEYLSEKLYNILKHYEINNGDLLIAIVGATIGKCSILNIQTDENVILTENCAKIKIRNSNIIPEYLLLILQSKFVQKQIQLNYIQTTLPKLGLDRVLSLYIPLIPKKQRQLKILDIFNMAYQSKQQKEAEAEKLLNSIDEYLLGELGITLPEKDNSLQNRIFKTSLSKVSGVRFDCDYHSSYFEQVINILNNCNYPASRIKKVADFQPGYAFSSNDYLNNSNCRLITIKNIRKNEIDITDATFLPDSFYDKYTIFKININDLVFAMTGATIGKVGIFETNVKALLNQRNGIIRSTQLNTYYLMNLLNTQVYQEVILRNAVGGAQPNISETGVMNIKIPIPPLEKQNEIAEHIKQIRNKVKQLQKEAIIELENAKQEIEKMILGDGGKDE